jgi:hypothetical protein
MYHGRMIRAAAEIEQLRRHRVRTGHDLAIETFVRATAENARKTNDRLGSLSELWHELVPPHLARHTAISALRRGVLHVHVDTAAAAFELDRLLRGGLTHDLRKRFRGSLIRVKTRVGPQ